jgi:hypothetical protein
MFELTCGCVLCRHPVVQSVVSVAAQASDARVTEICLCRGTQALMVCRNIRKLDLKGFDL